MRGSVRLTVPSRVLKRSCWAPGSDSTSATSRWCGDANEGRAWPWGQEPPVRVRPGRAVTPAMARAMATTTTGLRLIRTSRDTFSAPRRDLLPGSSGPDAGGGLVYDEAPVTRDRLVRLRAAHQSGDRLVGVERAHSACATIWRSKHRLQPGAGGRPEFRSWPG